MTLLFLESCEVDFLRWKAEGAMSCVQGGVLGGNAFVIPSAEQRFTNSILKQFRGPNEYIDQRKFRLSFWIKVDVTPTKDSEFISVMSKKENQGGMIGIDTDGKLYAGYLSVAGEWNGKYVESSKDSLTLADGKYHFVEINISWDSTATAYVSISVDGVSRIENIGHNVFAPEHCWSRPDTIQFGNLIGSNLCLDDIIMWDDTGDEYIGAKGPKLISYSEPTSFVPTNVDAYKKYLYDTYISNQTNAGVLTVIATEEPGSVSKLAALYESTTKSLRSDSVDIAMGTDTTISVFTGSETSDPIRIGFQRQ